MNEFLTTREQAYSIHQRIMANGKILQNALYEVCKDLKTMRDSKLYAELGYSSFEEYAEEACGIRQRQAYSYISAYEKLGKTYLQDNAQLGITKLELLSQVNSWEREEFAKEVDAENVSTRELKALVEKYKSQSEQLGFELEEAKAKIAESETQESEPDDDAMLEIKQLRAELEKAKAEQNKPSADSDNYGAKVQEALRHQQKKYDKEKKAAAEAAKAEMEKAAKAAKKEAKKEALEKVNQQLEQLTADKAAADEALEKALKEVKLTQADEDVVSVRFLFSSLQSTANQIEGHLANIKSRDQDKADKLSAAMKKVLEDIISSL